jgi:protein-L-isoaspartate(D-aspartate) O-methyltransferase
MSASALAARSPSQYNKLETAAQLILSLRQSGFSDSRILSAIESIPRHIFMPANLRGRSHFDRAFPIDCGQIGLPPSTIARMITALQPAPKMKVLEVGCGSGYMTAVLALLSGLVISVDRYRALVNDAQSRIRSLGLKNVVLLQEDGMAGFEAKSPYDRIVLTGAIRKMPDGMLDQLKPFGRCVAPIGEPGGEQQLTLYIRDENNHIAMRVLGTVRMVSLVSGKAACL